MNTPPVIGLVFSSQRNVNTVRKVLEDKPCRLVEAVFDLEDAVEPVRQIIEEQGVEVILSRRGTAYILRQLSVPVVALPDTTANQLRALKKASTMGRRIGITQIRTGECNLALCEELLGFQPEIILYSDKPSLEKGVVQAQQRGLEVIIGGDITRRAAQKCGLPFVDLHEQPEIPASFFDSIVNVVQTRRKTLKEKERYRSILDGISEGILAVDERGAIEEINPQACSMLQVNELNVIGTPVSSVFPALPLASAHERHEPLHNVTAASKHREQFIVNTIPIRVGKKPAGAVFSMQPASRILQAEERVRQAYNRGFRARYTLEDFLHTSSVVESLLEQARLYASSEAGVCITGESGTGKEILAQGIHNASPRRLGPFVSLNCAAMPESLLESELFGYAEGTFTGGRRGGKIGIFELAQGGTLFLDEVGTISLSFQTRLLRVLQEKEIMRLGSNVVVPADVRIIAAANSDLWLDVAEGRLREDLYYRLHVLPLHIPPLRERKEDIPLLAEAFLQEFCTQYEAEQRPRLQLPEAFVRALQALPWPGNVRQLRTVAERLTVVSPHGYDAAVGERLLEELRHPGFPQASKAVAMQRKSLTPERVREALHECDNSKVRAAAQLGISRSTLWRLCKDMD
ncbi:sigma 54-interacting transcriptional regulator [Desulfovibrio sp.]|uniref:sigma 54-interacting transcriptional regulator n=1 Tax=Desulfovibrio TaxID=872 RepID=UPI0025C629EF|nr:sigma 54-interacting transcriptional regulator [Desulfovibrio sp.]